jgi:hypothetical protein
MAEDFILFIPCIVSWTHDTWPTQRLYCKCKTYNKRTSVGQMLCGKWLFFVFVLFTVFIEWNSVSLFSRTNVHCRDYHSVIWHVYDHFTFGTSYISGWCAVVNQFANSNVLSIRTCTAGNYRCAKNTWRFLKCENQRARYAALPYWPSPCTAMFGV